MQEYRALSRRTDHRLQEKVKPNRAGPTSIEEGAERQCYEVNHTSIEERAILTGKIKRSYVELL